MPDFPGPVVVSGPPEWVPFVAFAAMAFVAVLLWPLIRAVARRLEGRGGDVAALRADVDQLHDRLAEAEQWQQRILELESRLEFSERLLAQQRDALLQRPEGGP